MDRSPAIATPSGALQPDGCEYIISVLHIFESSDWK